MATPNLALIPTGYKAGKVYSVLPETGVGDFAFTRASAATRINSNGLLEVPKYSIGGELVTNGDFATDTAWTKSPSGVTISGGAANFTSGQDTYVYQPILVIGKQYFIELEYNISPLTGGAYFGSNGGSGNAIINMTGLSGSGTLSGYITASSDKLIIRSNTLNGSIDNVSVIEQAINDVPRLQYPLIDGVVNGCPSLLLEPQATNLITYPISFGNPYWTKSGATIEGDPSTAGSELVTNGDFATSSDWGLNANWSISGGVAVADGTSNADMNQAFTAVINKSYAVTYDVVSISTGGFIIKVGGTIGTTRSEIGTYTEVLNAVSTDRIRISGTGSPNGSIDNVSVKEVQGYSSPSVDFPTSAFKLVEGTNTGVHYARRSISNTLNLNYTYSVIVKPNGLNYIRLQENTLTGAGGDFDFINKTGTPIQGNASNLITTTTTIQKISDGYFRISFTYKPNATGNYNFYNYLSQSAGVTSYTGDGTSGIYLFMAQLETGSVATSPTLTSLSAEGTTTTRVAETCNGAGDASTFNDSEGVLMLEASALANDGTNRVISISSGAYANSIRRKR